MPTVGERLRLERERRETPIEELARVTRIELRYFVALEGNEIDKLPGRAFGKLYIRAYADVLGFAPEELIEDYDREQRGPPEARDEVDPATRPVGAAIARWRESKLASGQPLAPADGPVVEPAGSTEEPVENAEPPRRRSRAPGRARVVLGSFVLLAGAVWLVLGLTRPSAVPRASASEDPPIASVEPAPTPVPPRAPEPTAPVAPVSHLTIVEHGVGRRVVGRTLEGQGDSFAEGQVVWFATRVLGGRRGEIVRHVWLHEGSVVHSIELELGGPHWRTYSRMTLGRAGRWTAEAHAPDGQTLARSTFICEKERGQVSILRMPHAIRDLTPRV